ncbi:hypothetical protein C4588_03985 [Candidatus Parcubacteria bacterium]|nr:MAG: hypothetical protein C4588_03985 [Candidatus Parcubacteria bacterium]
MKPFEIPNALPERKVLATELKVGQKLVMWSPTFSSKQNLSPITSVKVSKKTTRIEIEQGPLKVKGSIRYMNFELVRVVL